MIKRINQHPTLTDHGRLLVIMDKKGNNIDQLEIYPDSGDGCNTYLFDEASAFVVVDCNGQWVSIDKKTGKLKRLEWRWQEPLPNTRKRTLM